MAPKTFKAGKKGASKLRPFDVKAATLTAPKARKVAPKDVGVTAWATTYQKGPHKGETTGRMVLSFSFPASLNSAFKEALADHTWVGTPKWNNTQKTYDLTASCPKVMEAWMAKIDDTNAFKMAYASVAIPPIPEGYTPPVITIVVLDDGRVFLDATPANALYHHRDALKTEDVAFQYERNFADVAGLDRSVSKDAVDPDVVIDLLNEYGFDVDESNLASTTYAELRDAKQEP